MKINTTKDVESKQAALSDAQIDALVKNMGESLQKAKRVSVLLPKLPEDSGVVEVCINGYTVLVPRGQTLELPEPVAAVLASAGLL